MAPNEDVAEIEMWLKEELHLVSVEDEGDYVVIRPKEFLPPEHFKRIHVKIDRHRGEYVSNGRQSHWRILKNASQVGKAGRAYQFTGKGKLYAEAIEKIREIFRELEEQLEEAGET